MFSRNDNFKKSRTRTKKYGYLKKKSMKKRTKRKKKISKLKTTFKGGAETTVPSLEKMTKTCEQNEFCDIYQHSSGKLSCVDKSRIKVLRVLKEKKDSPVSFSSEGVEYNLIETIPFSTKTIEFSKTIGLDLLPAYYPSKPIDSIEADPASEPNLLETLNLNRKYIKGWYNIQHLILSSRGYGKAKVIVNKEDKQDNCKQYTVSRANIEEDKYTINTGLFFNRYGIFCNLIKDPDENLYLLFSSGNVLPKELLWENDDFNLYLQLLVNNIKLNLYDDKKVILCGHSMGCAVAQRLGFHIFEQEEDFFRSTVLVIGSGSFPWIQKEKKNYYKDMSNIFIFINTTVIEMTENNIIMDPTSCGKNGSLELYEPYFIIGSYSYPNTKQEFYFECKNNNRNLYCHSIERVYKYLHSWKDLGSFDYLSSLKKIFSQPEIKESAIVLPVR